MFLSTSGDGDLTYNQSINDLYMPANHNLYDYYVTDKPTNKFLKDILKANL